MDLSRWRQLSKLRTLLKITNKFSHSRRSWSCHGQSGYQQKIYTGKNQREKDPLCGPSAIASHNHSSRYKVLLSC